MNEELLSAVVHTALHAWSAAPSPHAEIGEHIAAATMHTEDGTVYVVTVIEIQRPPGWPVHLHDVIRVESGAAAGG